MRHSCDFSDHLGKKYIFVFLKKRNGLKGEYEERTLLSSYSTAYQVPVACYTAGEFIHLTWGWEETSSQSIQKQMGLQCNLPNIIYQIYLWSNLHNKDPVSNRMLLYMLLNHCSTVSAHAIYNSRVVRCYSELCCAILYVCASPFPQKVAFQVLKAEYHWYS